MSYFVEEYLRDVEEEEVLTFVFDEEPTEEEIHAERSERFLKDNHIVCPFEGYKELHKDGDEYDAWR